VGAPAQRYIHSYLPIEQVRLVRQGEFLAPWVQPGVDFSGCESVLEVGCGVGAQLRVLLQRFPGVRYTGVDVSAIQLIQARRILAEPLASGRVELVEASAFQLPFPDAGFDGACTFWVLEHLVDHPALLREVLRVLKPGGVLYCTEVFNSGLFTDPRQPGLERWWQDFNALQRELGGDPDVGIRLAALLDAAGFTDIDFHETSPQLDGRTRAPDDRRAFLDFWQALLLSGATQLQAHGRAGVADIEALKAAFAALADNPDAIFRYAAFQARGRKPSEQDRNTP
jgi:SAM-dependent methyltransferase